MVFRDRRQAGALLARKLEHLRAERDLIVLALPRGGVPVAYEVALALNAPLDVFLVRKLGFPGHEEYAMGAIATGGVRVMNPDVSQARVPAAVIAEVTAREQQELERRERLYRGNRPPVRIENRVVVLVDDGLATGSTMRAAAMAVKKLWPRRVVVAVPVAALQTCEALRVEVDEVVCAFTPQHFRAVGVWYEDFGQTSDDEVHALLEASAEAETTRAG